jgi:hypothetical protein
MENANLYRICTEDVNRENTRKIVSKYFDGFTLLSGEGIWKGSKENALVVEIFGNGDAGEPAVIGMLCEDIKAENKQEAVLLQVVEVKGYLI